MIYPYPEAQEEIPAIMLHTNNRPPKNIVDTLNPKWISYSTCVTTTTWKVRVKGTSTF